MTRPKDLGDQYPSDDGDIAPVNPTLGFSELDDAMIAGKDFDFLPTQDFDPDHITQHEQTIYESSFSGKIIKEVTGGTEYPKIFKVRLDNGNTVDATMSSMTDDKEFDANKDVTCYKTAYGWILRGEIQYKQLSVNVYKQWLDQTITGDGKINMAESVTELGDDLSGRIKIKRTGLYLVTYNVDLPTKGKIHYGKAYGEDWQQGAGSTRPCWINIKECEADGTIINETPFDVFFDRLRNSPNDYDPEVYENDIIIWEYDLTGRPVCISDVFKSKLGDAKFGSWALADIPTGWHEADGTTPAGSKIGALLDFTGRGGRIPKHKSSGESIGDKVGYQWHGQTEEDGTANNHSDHSKTDVAACILPHVNHTHLLPLTDEITVNLYPGANIYAVNFNKTDIEDPTPLSHNPNTQEDDLPHDGPFNENKDTDNRQPSTVVHVIQRYK